MPADFDACVNAGGRVRTMTLKGGKYMAVCYDKAGKSHAGEVKKKEEEAKPMLNEKLCWNSEFIVEKLGEKDEGVRIKGTAIKARESRNGIVYEMTELSKAKETLRNKSIALNHSENAEDVVGIIDEVFESADTLDYAARVYNTGKHPYVIELLQKGLIRHVSIEATTPQLEEKGGQKLARNLEFLGLAFVRHPGIPEASASIAEALEKKHMPMHDKSMDKKMDGEEHKCKPGMMWSKEMGKCIPEDHEDTSEEWAFLQDEEIVAEARQAFKKKKNRKEDFSAEIMAALRKINSDINDIQKSAAPSAA